MGLGGVAVTRPRAKSYNDFPRPLKPSPLSASFTKQRRTSISSGFQLRPQKDLPLRLQKRNKMSQSPPPSPKRTHPGGDDRQSKKAKVDKEAPPFKGLKPSDKHGLEKTTTLAGLKRSFEPEGDEPEFYSHRTKIIKLDDANEDESTRRTRVVNWASIMKRRRQLALSINRDFSKMPAAAQSGLPNLTGALCYRIALVQALCHIPQVVNCLWDYHLPELCLAEDRKDCFACGFRSLIKSYWIPTNQMARQPLFKALHALLRRRGWTQDGQADPGEQMLFFLKLLREDLPTSVFSMFDSTFKTFTTQTIPCSCGHPSISTDTQTQMSVALAPALNNPDLIRYIDRGLRDTIDYRCEKCKLIKKRQLTRKFEHLPEILCCQFNQQDHFGRKLKSNIKLPLALDLSRYKLAESTDPDKMKYDLISIVQHSGSDNFGHYICTTEGPDGNWKIFNDSQVRASPPGFVNRGFAPVLCFFRRIRDDPQSQTA